jgi:hypothetical protein
MKDAGAVLAELARRGLLMLQDPLLPSAVAILAGEPVRGSWWGHAGANDFFRILNQVDDHPDVLAVKLVGGKVTLVHRRLWPAVLAVAQAREPWQMRGLPAAARALLGRLDAGETIDGAGAAGKELEQRLLAHAEQVHTPSGKHVLRLSGWAGWAARAGCTPAASAASGKETLAQALVAAGGATALLPWNRKAR